MELVYYQHALVGMFLIDVVDHVVGYCDGYDDESVVVVCLIYNLHGHAEVAESALGESNHSTFHVSLDGFQCVLVFLIYVVCIELSTILLR